MRETDTEKKRQREIEAESQTDRIKMNAVYH